MFARHGWKNQSQARKQSRKQRFLGVESLETRAVMDGNLAAALSGGTLTITGDNAANVATLSSTASGDLVLTGAETTINGQTAPVTFSGVKNVVVRLNGGDDVFTIANGTEVVPTAEFNVSPATIKANVSVRGGEGNDSLTVVADMTGGLNLEGNNGDDSISIQDSYLAQNVTLDGGAGIDNLAVSASLLDRSLRLEGGMGSDTLSLDGTEVGRDVVFSGSGGDDMISMTNDSTARHLQMWGGSGNDTIETSNAGVSTFGLWGGSGEDQATLTGVDVSDLLFADMGDGDDTLAINETSAGWSILWGGWGNDTFQNGTGNSLGRRWTAGF